MGIIHIFRFLVSMGLHGVDSSIYFLKITILPARLKAKFKNFFDLKNLTTDDTHEWNKAKFFNYTKQRWNSLRLKKSVFFKHRNVILSKNFTRTLPYFIIKKRKETKKEAWINRVKLKFEQRECRKFNDKLQIDGDCAATEKCFSKAVKRRFQG